MSDENANRTNIPIYIRIKRRKRLEYTKGTCFYIKDLYHGKKILVSNFNINIISLFKDPQEYIDVAWV